MDLIIDSSKKKLYIGIKTDKIKHFFFDTAGKHSEFFIVKIEEVLNSNNLKLKDIKRIYCGIGPGSFTGIRLGITICKVLAYTLECELYAISSLALMTNSQKEVIVIDDAKSKKSYLRIQAKLRVDILDTIIANEEIDSYLQKYNSYEVFNYHQKFHEYDYTVEILDEFSQVKTPFDLRACYIKEI